mgnify:CR=1 FL=1
MKKLAKIEDNQILISMQNLNKDGSVKDTDSMVMAGTPTGFTITITSEAGLVVTEVWAKA